MPLLAFTLSMPNRNSWNGRWSGEETPYVKVLKVGAKCAAKPGDYSYSFGDGWRANVNVREIDGTESRKLRRISAGFRGYDWMIDDIRTYGRIRSYEERRGRA